MQSFGRGRGALMAQVMTSGFSSNTKEKEKTIGRGNGLMTPREFLKSQSPTDEVELGTKNNNQPEVIKPEEVLTLSVSEPVVKKIIESNTENEKIIQAEQEWQILKCKRRINKMLKNVESANLNKVMKELEAFIEECPLSSRYTNCSEINEIIEVLIQKAVEKEEFLEFAPCLLKQVSVHSPIAFQTYFQDIVDYKRQECITLCASDKLLSNTGERFCKLLGHVFVLPRQTGDSFYTVVSPVVEECVERWTFPDEASMNGFRENIASVFAVSVKTMLMQIVAKMLPCDGLVGKRVERFMWLIRESILNTNLPRKIREIYLDSLIDIQLEAQRINVQLVRDDTSEEVNIEEEDVESCEVVTTDTSSFTTKKEQTNDGSYTMISHLLKEQDMDDLLQVFQEHNIQDSLLTSPDLKLKMEKAGVEKFKCFQFAKALESIGIENLHSHVFGSNVKNSFEDTEENDISEVPNENKFDAETKPVERPRSRNSASSRMAINFTKLSKPTKEVKNVTTPAEEDSSSETSSGPDIVIESEEEVFDVSLIEVETDVQCSEEKSSNSSEETEQCFVPIEPEMYQPEKLPVGRGRGCFTLPAYNKQRNRPYQNTTEVGRQDRRPNKGFFKDNQSKKWTSRDNGSSDWRSAPRDKTFNRSDNTKLQARYHPKEKEGDEKTTKSSTKLSFGTAKPKFCLRCQATNHLADNCPVINPFF
ncbi:uncharacterized protein LOC130644314 [Hydractinia symbiolongicarpus]|uniref:uncharacterized protein LOC130644314 n=1 Tax=Hydractinia symbiolongicarpus TaxID=13093 RepID=UPI00254E9D69|nr:uncharacterized protein LOC130644314 [Hydractinia symbiolongicarpus]